MKCFGLGDGSDNHVVDAESSRGMRVVMDSPVLEAAAEM